MKKLPVAHRLLRLCGVDQIHIAGCSRSGTTVFQYAMVAFENTLIPPDEHDIDYPFLGDSIRMARHALTRGGRWHLVTKRDYDWFREAPLRRLVERARDENLGFIYMVRDPRDVLCSTHEGAKSDQAYVTPEHWVQSIRAGNTALRALEGYPRKLVLRYEDFVVHTSQVEDDIARVFGLRLKAGVASMAEVKTNIERERLDIGREGERAMHSLRNVDSRSCGRWRRLGFDIDGVVTDGAIRTELQEFMATHGYADP